MSKLHIGDNLTLPLDAVTQTFAILGIRGSGKTNTAVVMMEEMVKQGQQCAVLDPTDAWYGLRSSRDGKSEGLKVYVFGGEHGDLPLEGGHGAEMANFVIESGASVVFSLRHLSMADQRRFAADFGERLRLLKAKPENRNPLHIFLDEAEEFVPQNLRDNDARMFGAFNRMVRRDRNIGLGITLISQRPQSVNKEPLSQIETLICHRLLHKLDRKSVKESWVEGHDDAGRAEQFFNSLAALEKGQVWVWSPYWLDIFKNVQVRWRETFDSSATPKAGQRVPIATVRAPVDLDLLRKRLSASIEKAKADDPRELRKQVAELQRQLRTAPAAKVVDEAVIQRAVEKAVSQRDREHKTQLSGYQSVIEKMQNALATIGKVVAQFVSIELPKEKHVPLTVEMAVRRPPSPQMTARTTQPRREPPTEAQDGELKGPERRILNAIAWLNSIGVEDPEQTAVAFLAGYKIGGGAFNNPRGRLNQLGLVQYLSGDRIRLTDEGIKLAQVPDEVLDAEELQQRVLSRLPGPEKKILSVLLEHREGLSNEELAELSGYAQGGGAYNNPRGKLRTLGLIEYVDGKVVPKPLLYLEAA